MRLGFFVVSSAVAVLVLGTLSFQAVQLSSVQVAQSELGDASALVVFPGAAPVGGDYRSIKKDIAIAAEAAGASELTVSFFAAQIRDSDARMVNLIEQPSAQSESMGVTLVSGSWPRDASEAVVSSAYAKLHPIGSSVTMFNGALTARIVGVAQNDYYRSSSEVYLGPGAWSSLRSLDASTAERLDAAADIQAFWNGGDPETVAQSIAAVVPHDRELGLQTREQILSLDSARYVELQLVALLAPLVAGLVGSLIATRFMRRIRSSMHAVGVSFN